MSADTVFDALCQTRLCLQELCKRLLAIFRIAMQVDGTPSPVFAIKQLVWTLQFVIIVLCTTTISAAPVLDNVPVRALATIAGSNQALVAASGVE